MITYRSNIDGPKFSVIITCWNRYDFVEQAIESVLNQTVQREFYEIILVTNVSNDKIERLCSENDVKIIKNNNSKQGPFFLSGIKDSKGEYLVFLNDDDLFHPTKLFRINSVIDAYGVLAYYHNASCPFGANVTTDQILEQSNMNTCDAKLELLNAENECGLLKNYFYNYYWAGDSSIAVRKQIVLENEEFLSETDVIDQNLFYTALYRDKAVSVHDPCALTFLRVHNSLSNTFSPNFKEFQSRKAYLYSKQFEDCRNRTNSLGIHTVIHTISNMEVQLRLIIFAQKNGNLDICSLFFNIDTLIYINSIKKITRKSTSLLLLLLSAIRITPIIGSLSPMIYFALNKILGRNI